MMQSLKIKSKLYSLQNPMVMGILNVTPDSFYDGGTYTDQKTILERTKQMHTQGVDIIDVGGYSSRPGANPISLEEEKKRVLFAIELIKKNYPDILLSVDTFRSSVAEAAIRAGSNIINDISAGELDKAMFETVAKLRVPYILMHMKGNPQTMQTQSNYTNLLEEIIDFFQFKIKKLNSLGINDLIVDPGFGFAKTKAQNFYLLQNLNVLKLLDRPILVGLSNKSMIYKTLDIPVKEAENGTTVLNTLAIAKGANLLRVHNVKALKETLKLYQETKNAEA